MTGTFYLVNHTGLTVTMVSDFLNVFSFTFFIFHFPSFRELTFSVYYTYVR